MLKVHELETAYGSSQVLFGVSLDVGEGEVVALLGRNGAGKTTTLSSIMGLVPPQGGRIMFRDRPIIGPRTLRNLSSGHRHRSRERPACLPR